MNGTRLLGLYVRQLRIERGYSLREMGVVADLSHTQIDIIEKGYDPRTGRRANTTVETLQKLARALAVPFDRFVDCLEGRAAVTLTRPYEQWHSDEKEDWESSDGEEREYLRLRYGCAKVIFTPTEDTALRSALFGGDFRPTEEEWAMICRLVDYIKSQRGGRR